MGLPPQPSCEAAGGPLLGSNRLTASGTSAPATISAAGALVDGKGHCFHSHPEVAAPANELQWFESPPKEEMSRQRQRRRRQISAKILRGRSPRAGNSKENARGRWYPVSACGTVPSAGGMTLEARANGRVDRIGIMRCGSVWTCPECAQRVAVRRGQEIAQVIDAARDAGCRTEMVTFTQPHDLTLSAEECMRRLKDALREFASGGVISRLLAKLGFIGQVKSIEVTRGWTSGWHFHAHAIFVFEPTGTSTTANEDLAASIELKKKLYPIWKSACHKAGSGTPNFRYGLDVRAVWSGTDYIQKMPEQAVAKAEAGKQRWGADAELSKAYLKEGRKSSRTVWEILDTAETNAADAELFAEYARATWGRSQIEWSKGKRDLRKIFLSDAEEIDDERLVYEDPDWVFSDEVGELPDVGEDNLVVERVTIASSDAWRARAHNFGSLDRACSAVENGEALSIVDVLRAEGWVIEKQADMGWGREVVEDAHGYMKEISVLTPAEYVATWPPLANWTPRSFRGWGEPEEAAE